MSVNFKSLIFVPCSGLMILIHDVILLDTTSHDKKIFKEEMGQQSLVNVFWIIRICDLRAQPQNTELCKSK